MIKYPSLSRISAPPCDFGIVSHELFSSQKQRKQGVERDAFKEKTFPYPPRQIVYSLNKVLQPPTKLIHSLVEHLPIP